MKNLKKYFKNYYIVREDISIKNALVFSISDRYYSIYTFEKYMRLKLW